MNNEKKERNTLSLDEGRNCFFLPNVDFAKKNNLINAVILPPLTTGIAVNLPSYVEQMLRSAQIKKAVFGEVMVQ